MRIITRKRRRRRRTYRTGVRGISLVPSRISIKRPTLDKMAALGVIFGVVIFFVYSGFSWAFYNYPIEIEGDKLLGEEAIKERCGLEYYHIFFVNSKKCERKLLKMVEIKKAHVSVSFPARIRIYLEEREPVIEWVSGGKRFWLDEEGVFMEYRHPLPNLLLIVDESGTLIRPGDKLHRMTLEAALQLRNLGISEGEIHYHPDEGFILINPSGYPVFLGIDASLMEARLEAYIRLRDYLRVRGINPRYIDVRSPEAPVYSF